MLIPSFTLSVCVLCVCVLRSIFVYVLCICTHLSLQFCECNIFTCTACVWVCMPPGACLCMCRCVCVSVLCVSLQFIRDETGFLHQEVCPHNLLPQPPQTPNQHRLPEGGEKVAEKKGRQRRRGGNAGGRCSASIHNPHGHEIDFFYVFSQCTAIFLSL